MADEHPVTTGYVVEVLLALLLTATLGAVLLVLVPHAEAHLLDRQALQPAITRWTLATAHFLGTHWMHVLLPLILLLAECCAHGRIGAWVRRSVIALMLAGVVVAVLGVYLPTV